MSDISIIDNIPEDIPQSLPKRIQIVIERHPEIFKEGFAEDLLDNYPLWNAFEILSNYKRRTKNRWAARHAFHKLRSETKRADTDETYKIDNCRSRNWARLYNRLNGFEFFQERNHYGEENEWLTRIRKQRKQQRRNQAA
jgi:hypothetical protein